MVQLEKYHIEQKQKETKRTVCILLENDLKIVEQYKAILLRPDDRVILINGRPEHESFKLFNKINFPFLNLAGYDHDIYQRMQAVHRENTMHFMKKAALILTPLCYVEAYGLIGGKETLLESVLEFNPSFIIIGREKSFLGSLTKHFLLESPIPIMIAQ